MNIVKLVIFIVCVFLVVFVIRDTLIHMNDSLSANNSTQTINIGNHKNLKLNSYEYYIATSSSCSRIDKYTPEFKTIIGHDHAIQEIESIISLWDHANFKKGDVLYEPPTGVLLYGPPGTGKTTIAKQICSCVSNVVSFLHVSSDMVENKYQGEGLKLMKSVFTLASKIEPCIIFFDEIDGFMSKRSDMDQSHVNTMKTIMLTSLDQLKDQRSRVLMIAATNRPDSLDSALMRRLELQILVDRPSMHEKCMPFVTHFGGNVDDYISFVNILPITYTIHDIYSFLKFCIRKNCTHDIDMSIFDVELLTTLYTEYSTKLKFVG